MNNPGYILRLPHLNFSVQFSVTYPASSNDRIRAIYSDFGLRKGQEASEQKPQDAEKLYQLLGNYILEGMPCDRVSAIKHKDENKIAWETERCVHRSHWEKGGLEPQVYYAFGTAFTKEFLRPQTRLLNMISSL